MAQTNMQTVERGFAFHPLARAEWRNKGVRSFLQYRDLGAVDATNGKMKAEHIRAIGSGEMATGWHCHDLDFQFVYVLGGQVAFTAEDWGDVVLNAGDCAYIPPLTMHVETSFSPDFQVLEVTLPAEFRTLTEKPVKQPPDRKMVVDHLAGDTFKAGSGLRSFLEYRNFGLAEATNSVVAAQIVRSNGPLKEPTGWHYHVLDIQFVYLLQGSVTAQIDGIGDFQMLAGDAMVVPSGMKHNVCNFSDDFEILEINSPAEFETIQM
jgi:quercetin dioxygenase-like cupin family protein